jgi:hypothetical protein
MRDPEKMSIDPEGALDSPRNSLTAVLSALAAMIGGLALVAPSFAIASVAAVLLGLAVLVFARKWELSQLSVRLARFSVYFSMFCGMAGMTRYWMQERQFENQATAVAQKYLQALAAGDRTTAIGMVGLPPLVEDAAIDEAKMSREQSAVRSFLNDPNIKAVIDRGSRARWLPHGIRSKHRTGRLLEVEVSFVDASEVNPKPVVVDVKVQFPDKESPEQKRFWVVEQVRPVTY